MQIAPLMMAYGWVGQRGSPDGGREEGVARSLAGAGHLQNPFTAKVIRGIEREREGDMTTGHGERMEEWESVHPSVRPSFRPRKAAGRGRASDHRGSGIIITK